MSVRVRSGLLLVAFWAVIVAGGLAARPAWPIDETRYLSVAWEMWQQGDVLVPHLNGVPYSDKPPLLFWLILAGWKAFGVVEWWPRLVPGLFALASLFLTANLARRLWPDREEIARAAPLLLLATFFWSFFSTVLLFDMLLVFFALVAITGLVRASRGERGGWIAVALGTGFGILAKGPAMLLWVLPVAVTAPWWSGGVVRFARWYPRLLGAIAAGLALALAWAVPAALSGGSAYADAILWNQTAGRVTHAFAHQRPLWWYAPVLPLLALPWLLGLRLWRAPREPGVARDAGVRLCAVWSLAGLAAFSLVSGKQMQYLLPLLPPLVLLAGRFLQLAERPEGRRELAPVAAGLLLLGAVFGSAHWLDDALALPYWVASLPPAAGAGVAATGILLLLAPVRSRIASVELLAGCSVAALVIMLLAVGRAATPSYDVFPIARLLNRLQSEGRPLAHVGKYHGEYQFAGRLERPLEVIGPEDLAAWFSRHPEGYVVVFSDRRLPEPEDELRHDFRGGIVAVRHRFPRPAKPQASASD